MPSPKTGATGRSGNGGEDKQTRRPVKTAETAITGKAASGRPKRARSRSAPGPESAAAPRARGPAEVLEVLKDRAPGSLTLVVTEKPSVARDIAKALGRRGESFTRYEGFLAGGKYFVTWAVGHLLELCEPEDYDPKYKTWRLGDLPIVPDRFRLKPLPRTITQLQTVVGLLRSPAFGEVVNACDAGREGELIFRHLLEVSGVDGPAIKRLWVSAMTDEAILEGFANLADGAAFENLEAAARCRSESDWLVGINATRGMTKKCGGRTVLSIGRVQTPTLAILAEREREIAAFVPQKYWEVEASFAVADGVYRGRWFSDAAPDGRLPDQTAARELAERVAGKPGTVDKVDSRSKSHPPLLLYDLTQLQRDMNRRYGFTAARTLGLAQDLYEKYKVITYPRTDSRFLHSKNVPLLAATLRAVGEVSDEFRKLTGRVLETGGPPVTGRLVNDARVRDHHAIIPTLKAAAASGLKGDHAKVFEAVARRFVAAFYPAAVIEDTSVVTLVEGEKFLSRGRTVREQGWLEVEPADWLTRTAAADRRKPASPETAGDEDEDETPRGALPSLREGLSVTTVDAGAVEKVTRPPARYTEASLLQAMETAGRLLDDEDLQEVMKEKGIGTPATRAAIIERLIEVGYVERDRRALVVTPKGLEVVAAIPTRELVSPALTGAWEARLRRVERGEAARATFMAEIEGFVKRMVNEIKAMEADGLAARMQRRLGSCPRCGEGQVLEGPRSYYCSRGRECGFYIWKVLAGRRLSAKEVAKLLAEGRTDLLRGFRSRKGGRFSAFLTLDNGTVSLTFPERRVAAGRNAEGRGPKPVPPA